MVAYSALLAPRNRATRQRSVVDGLSLMVNVTILFVVELSISKVYGFNMYVVSNDIMAMLDSLVLTYVSEL